MELLDLRQWNGTRLDLLSILQDFENKAPKRYGLFSKTGGKLLPVKERRIQQFIDMGILPKPNSFRSVSGEKKHGYDFEHVVRYIAAITLRKRKYTLEQAGDLLMKMDIFEVIDVASTSENDDFSSFSKKLPVAEGGGFNSHDLMRLGRDEGRALKSEQILLAITPWCHVYVSKRRLEELEPGDISVLCGAFEDGLRSIIKS